MLFTQFEDRVTMGELSKEVITHEGIDYSVYFDSESEIPSDEACEECGKVFPVTAISDAIFVEKKTVCDITILIPRSDKAIRNSSKKGRAVISELKKRQEFAQCTQCQIQVLNS